MVTAAMAQEPTSSPPSTVEATDSEQKSLDIGGAVATGIKWKALTQVVSECSRVVVTLVLTRLLTPADYGVAGMAIVCASFATLFTDPALGMALIQRPQITEADRSTAFWTTVSVGAIATIVGIALSGVVADLFGEPEVKNLFIALSLGFVVTALAATQTSLLARDLAYRSLEIREIAATLLGAVAALVVAIAGFGPWAIIANWLVGVVTTTVLVWFLSPWRPHATFSRDSLRDLGGFGSKVFGARILGWGNLNADKFIVGRQLGPSALGAYSLAYNVMFMPVARIAIPIAHILSPAYARMQDDPERLERAWLKSKRISVALLAPGFLACLVVAPDLVPVAFGSQWNAVIVPLQLLCVAGVASSLTTLGFGILMACGKGGTLLRLNILTSAVTVSAFLIGVRWGIVGVAGSYAAARWLLVILDTKITTRAVSFDFWRTLAAGAGVLLYSVGAAASAFGVREILLAEDVPAVARLFIASAAFFAVYLLLLRLFTPSLLAEIIDMLRRRRGPASTAAGSPASS